MSERNEVRVRGGVRPRGELSAREVRWRTISCAWGFGLGTERVTLLAHASDEFVGDGRCLSTPVLHRLAEGVSEVRLVVLQF